MPVPAVITTAIDAEIRYRPLEGIRKELAVRAWYWVVADWENVL